MRRPDTEFEKKTARIAIGVLCGVSGMLAGVFLGKAAGRAEYEAASGHHVTHEDTVKVFNRDDEYIYAPSAQISK